MSTAPDNDQWHTQLPGPMTDAERRFRTLRSSGYTGPVDQNGHPYDDPWPFP